MHLLLQTLDIFLVLHVLDYQDVFTVRLMYLVKLKLHSHQIISLVDLFISVEKEEFHYLQVKLVVVLSKLEEKVRLTSVFSLLVMVYSDLLVISLLVLQLVLKDLEIYLHTLAVQSLLLQFLQPKNQSSHSLVHLEIQEFVLHMKDLVLYSQLAVEILEFSMHTRLLDLLVSVPRNQNLVSYRKRSILKSTVWISALINQNLIMAELLILVQLLFVLMLTEISAQVLQQELDVQELHKDQPYQLILM